MSCLVMWDKFICKEKQVFWDKFISMER